MIMKFLLRGDLENVFSEKEKELEKTGEYFPWWVGEILYKSLYGEASSWDPSWISRGSLPVGIIMIQPYAL